MRQIPLVREKNIEVKAVAMKWTDFSIEKESKMTVGGEENEEE